MKITRRVTGKALNDIVVHGRYVESTETVRIYRGLLESRKTCPACVYLGGMGVCPGTGTDTTLFRSVPRFPITTSTSSPSANVIEG